MLDGIEACVLCIAERHNWGELYYIHNTAKFSTGGPTFETNVCSNEATGLKWK